MLRKAGQMMLSALTSPELTLLRRAAVDRLDIRHVALPRKAAMPVIRTAFELAPSGWMPRTRAVSKEEE